MKLSELRFSKGAFDAITFPLETTPDLKTTMVDPVKGEPGRVNKFNFDELGDDLKEVVEVRLKAQNDIFPFKYLSKHFPKQWGKFDPALIHFKFLELVYDDKIEVNSVLSDLWAMSVAKVDSKINAGMDKMCQIVRMDDPMDLFFLMKDIIGPIEIKGFESKHSSFHKKTSDLNYEVSKVMRDKIKNCFAAKYYYGVPRPEEALAHLYPGIDWRMFTAYSEGSPSHPSYPAGHACFAGAILSFLLDNVKMDTLIISKLRTLAYMWAMLRTIAGVHYTKDNIQGLMVVGGAY